MPSDTSVLITFLGVGDCRVDEINSEPLGTGLWEDLVEDEVDHDAGYGDVHPNRPGPAGDGFVTVEALF